MEKKVIVIMYKRLYELIAVLQSNLNITNWGHIWVHFNYVHTLFHHPFSTHCLGLLQSCHTYYFVSVFIQNSLSISLLTRQRAGWCHSDFEFIMVVLLLLMLTPSLAWRDKQSLNAPTTSPVKAIRKT